MLGNMSGAIKGGGSRWSVQRGKGRGSGGAGIVEAEDRGWYERHDKTGGKGQRWEKREVPVGADAAAIDEATGTGEGAEREGGLISICGST